MRLTCPNCRYWNRSVDQWPCDSCHDAGGVMTNFTPDSDADEESNGCNGDYCEISFEEE